MEKDIIHCEDCGTEDGVMLTHCPFAEEINYEIIVVHLCDKCYTERCMDI